MSAQVLRPFLSAPLPARAAALALMVLLPGSLAAQAQNPAANPPYVSPPAQGVPVYVPPLPPTSEPAAPLSGVVTVPEGEPLPAGPIPPRQPVADPAAQVEEDALAVDIPGLERAMVVAPPVLSAPIVNVPGMNSGSAPPDTVGDVGPNHYVQMVNSTTYQIFDKQGGALTGAILLSTLWAMAGGNCNADKGDPIVVYDHLADRWLISQFADPQHMCIAISQTPDPTAGTWFLYEFDVGVFPDYPKFGVWPDAYYMSSYLGANLGIHAFERSEMLLGNAAQHVSVTIPSLGTASVRDTRILPADLDGPPPPAGTPNYFVRPVDDQQDPGDPTDRIEVREVVVDWSTPSITQTLTDTLLPAAFQIMLCNRGGGGIRDCIPQPDTAQTVDALSNRPMMQAKYRNFGTHAAIVFNQTIDVSGAALPVVPANEVAGIRWYELRRAAGAWAIQQEGTFTPQDPAAATEAELLHRWMGSTAMDKEGNIALGYNIVNDDDTNGAEVFPGIRYTARAAADAAGTMRPEETILDGTDSQTDSERWGDYSALSVDPVDDCTFWYTTHVAPVGGAGARPTQIASFRLLTFDDALCGVLGNCSYEDDLIHSQWTATQPNPNYSLTAPQVNPQIIPTGQMIPLNAPAGCNFIGIVNPGDGDVSGKLAHDAVAGNFPAGTKFVVKVWGNRGRLAGATSATFPRARAASRLQLRFLGWGPGAVPVVSPTSDNWSRHWIFSARRNFSAWGANGDWSMETFEFVTTRDLAYVSLSLAGLNRIHFSYVAFDIGSFIP